MNPHLCCRDDLTGKNWVFSIAREVVAGVVEDDVQDYPKFNKMRGGVPLGLKIAEDIFANGLKSLPASPPSPAPAIAGAAATRKSGMDQGRKKGGREGKRKG